MNNSGSFPTEGTEAEWWRQELAKLLRASTEAGTIWRPEPPIAGAATPGIPSDTTAQNAGQAHERRFSALASSVTSGILGGETDPGFSLRGVDSVRTGPGALLLGGPLWAGLLRLFGGGGPDPAPEKMRYEPPGQKIWELGFRHSSPADVFAADQDSTGAPRSWSPVSQRAPLETTTPVRVEIQALDSRSILDRSDDLADAIRRALSESHKLNDYLVEE